MKVKQDKRMKDMVDKMMKERNTDNKEKE